MHTPRVVETLRREPGASRRLREEDLDPDPLRQFDLWLAEALQVSAIVDPHAMTLATATADGVPSARIVLLRGFDARGFVFFTSYEGRKARDLEANPRAALVIYWAELERQVRIEGAVTRTSSDESDAYFQTRPPESRLAACAARQSAVMASRGELEQAWQDLQRRYPDGNIPRPESWGGYRVHPVTIEFWQSGLHRLHDRLVYRRQPDGRWLIERLAP